MAGLDSYKSKPNSAQARFRGKGGIDQEKVRVAVERSRPYFELVRRVEGEFGNLRDSYEGLPKELKALWVSRRIYVESELLNGVVISSVVGIQPALDVGSRTYKRVLKNRYGVILDNREARRVAALREAQRQSDREFEESYASSRGNGNARARLNGAARGGRKSRITDEQIRAAHSDKKTAAEMAKEFGIGRNQVYVRLRALRLKPNGRIRQGQGSALTHHDGRTAL